MYSVLFKQNAKKEFSKLDRQNQKRIFSKIKQLSTILQLGVPLVGKLAGLWKLRVGDYRIIYELQKANLIIYVLKIGHRKNVYD